MGRVGWGISGKKGVNFQSMGEMGKDFCPNFLLPFLENIGRRGCNDGCRETILVFHTPHRKYQTSSSAVARTLEYVEGVHSQAAASERKEKQVRINIQEALRHNRA